MFSPTFPLEEGTVLVPTKRPFIIVDPRAGHSPGIGGMKQDSEIGVARAAGYPCYFVGFLPVPMAGRTIEDVCRAEAHFREEVVRRHPQAEGKPNMIGSLLLVRALDQRLELIGGLPALTVTSAWIAGLPRCRSRIAFAASSRIRCPRIVVRRAYPTMAGARACTSVSTPAFVFEIVV